MMTRTIPPAFRNIPNIGPAVAQDLQLLGFRSLAELKGKDPQRLYQELCDKTGARQDPCVLDTFCALVDQAEGKDPRPWYHYSRERKARQSIRRRQKA